MATQGPREASLGLSSLLLTDFLSKVRWSLLSKNEKTMKWLWHCGKGAARASKKNTSRLRQKQSE